MTTEQKKFVPVILSGGAGTRLWPISRKHYPKQFLDLMGNGKTMLQLTALRTVKFGSPVVVCSEQHRFLVAEQMAQIGIVPRAIILEPVGRNTAPAIAVAAHFIKDSLNEDLMGVFPADHVITEQQVFHDCLEIGVDAAKEGNLITFGVVPDKPETGYGYIKVDPSSGNDVRTVVEFVEKPNLPIAKSYLESGSYLWNSGMFMFSATLYLKELQKNVSQIVEHTAQSLIDAKTDLDFIRLDISSFESCKNISIDYAVMEQSDKVVSVSLDVGWSDVGNWESLWEVCEKDSNNNVLLGDTFSLDSQNTYVHSNEKLAVLIGVEDLIVVDSDDALLIADKSKSQQVKRVVEFLEQNCRTEHLHHRNVHRPWGCYDSIKSGVRYQVKELVVKPGESLSLQLHYHRAEHWVVVEGTALVVLDHEEKMLCENESIYIPAGTKHQLSNPGKIPLKVIEVQSGSYLREDDIVRFNDPYKRDN